MPQTWDLTLVPLSVVGGSGNATSQGGDNGVGTPVAWDIALNIGIAPVTGAGNATSTSGDSGVAALNIDWYTLDADVGTSGIGNATSSAGDAGVSTTSPPAASGSGNATSSAVGSVSVGIFNRPFSVTLDRASGQTVTLDRSAQTFVVLSTESPTPT